MGGPGSGRRKGSAGNKGRGNTKVLRQKQKTDMLERKARINKAGGLVKESFRATNKKLGRKPMGNNK